MKIYFYVSCVSHLGGEIHGHRMLEFLTGQKYATVTFTSKRHINRVKRIYQNRKDEFKYFHENEDGSIVAKFPMNWIKVNPGAAIDADRPKRELTPGHKQKLLAGRSAARTAKQNT